MIAYSSRTLSRIALSFQFTSSYHTIFTLTRYLQGNHSYHGLRYISKKSVTKGVQCPMGWNKKRKTGTPVWRPISTQCSSNEECLDGDVMAEPQDNASIEQDEHENQIVSVVRDIAQSTISTSSVRVENTVAEEAVVAIPTSTCQNIGLKDADDMLGDPAATSAMQSSCEVGDDEKASTLSKEKHSVSMEIGASVMRFIRGKDGSMQKSLEEDMGVKIIFPSSKEEDSIVIEGESVDVINKASEKIQAIIDEAVKSPAFQYSHFVSLPLAIYPELVDKLSRFQCTILGDCDTKDVEETANDVSTEEDDDKIDQPGKTPDVAVKLQVEDDTNRVNVSMDIPLVSYAPTGSKSPTLSDLGIDKSIFIKPKTFHLTVLMLKLWNKERVHAATEVLQSVSSKVIEVLDNRPLFVRLKGLDCMRGSRAKAHVLYAPVEEVGNEGRLSRACQVIIDAYVKAGLVLERDIGQKLKLHATVMNTTHRRTRNRKGRKRSEPFDARGIFDKFGSEHWGDYHIREAHLSQRFLYDDNGYYHCCASIPFPENASSS